MLPRTTHLCGLTSLPKEAQWLPLVLAASGGWSRIATTRGHDVGSALGTHNTRISCERRLNDAARAAILPSARASRKERAARQLHPVVRRPLPQLQERRILAPTSLGGLAFG